MNCIETFSILFQFLFKLLKLSYFLSLRPDRRRGHGILPAALDWEVEHLTALTF